MKKFKWISVPIAVLLIAGSIIGWQYWNTPRVEAVQGTLSLNIGINNLKQDEKPTEVIIGDAQPSIQFKRWNGECSISLSPNVIASYSKTTIGNKANFDNANISFEYEPTPVNNKFNELGGYDLTITLKHKPVTNGINFNYDSELVNAYLQRPLNEELKIGDDDIISVNATHAIGKDGRVVAYRPDYVVNSIVFYHSSKSGNNYKTGEIGHLYRMKAIDSLGKWVWADWGISGLLISLKVSQTFLDNAVYPVIITPVGDWFGFNTKGATRGNSAYVAMCKFTSNANFGTATSMSCYGYSDGGTIVLEMALYADSAGTPTTQLIIPPVEVSVNTTEKWWTQNISYVGAGSTPYWLCKHNKTNYIYYYYNSGDANQYANQSGWNNPAAPHSWYAAKLSIYVTYTPTGGTPSISNTPSSKDMGTVYAGKTVYAKGAVPNNPVIDNDCTFTMTNDGSITENVTIQATNFTGGTGWNWTSGAPGLDTIRGTFYGTGDNPTNGVVISTSAQAFHAPLASSATWMWDFKLELGTSTDTTAKSCNITLTAISP